MLPGLSLIRTYAFNSKTLDNKAQLDEWMLGVLEENPKLTIDGIVEAVVQRHGDVVSRAGVSRSRQRLNLNPDDHYARNALRKFKHKADDEVKCGEH
ncbi:MAG: hypothetical protein EOP06_11240 [Proteobacteria bacterium]|nr:MAG: hypothetical protein EOP06_11240 [Pseudomonadota bacterium]